MKKDAHAEYVEETKFDWRLEDVGRVGKNPPAFCKEGDRILLISAGKHKRYKTLSFYTPNAAALALNIAINSAIMADALRPRLRPVRCSPRRVKEDSRLRRSAPLTFIRCSSILWFVW